jgi:hypothetical protein
MSPSLSALSCCEHGYVSRRRYYPTLPTYVPDWSLTRKFSTGILSQFCIPWSASYVNRERNILQDILFIFVFESIKYFNRATELFMQCSSSRGACSAGLAGLVTRRVSRCRHQGQENQSDTKVLELLVKWAVVDCSRDPDRCIPESQTDKDGRLYQQFIETGNEAYESQKDPNKRGIMSE